GTVEHPAGPAGADDAGRAETSIQRGAVARPAGPGAAAGENAAKTSTRRMPPDAGPGAAAGGGTAAAAMAPAFPAPPGRGNPGAPSAAHPHQRNGEQSGKGPMHPGTVRPTEGPFRRALLSSAVGNTP